MKRENKVLKAIGLIICCEMIAMMSAVIMAVTYCIRLLKFYEASTVSYSFTGEIISMVPTLDDYYDFFVAELAESSTMFIVIAIITLLISLIFSYFLFFKKKYPEYVPKMPYEYEDNEEDYEQYEEDYEGQELEDGDQEKK